MADQRDAGKSVAIGGDVIGELLSVFQDGDDLVEQLRKRAAYIGASYGIIDDLTGIGEGSTGKYLAAARVRALTVSSLLKIATALGLTPMLVVDEALTRKMQRQWSKRDAAKVHSRRLPPIGQAQLRRVIKPVAAEMGRRGGVARMSKLSHQQRREIGRRGAQMRWHPQREPVQP
jgi:hypothetical protein